MSENDRKSRNGLYPVAIASEVTEREEIGWDSLYKKLKDTFAEQTLVYTLMDQAACLGLLTKQGLMLPENIEFSPEYLQSIRVFNINKEIYAWRKGQNAFYYRLRVDKTESLCEPEKAGAIDAFQLMWGSRSNEMSSDGKWTKYKEDRGIEYWVPNQIFSDLPEQLWLHTRNYIGFTENYQAGYVDCRFVDIGLRGGEANEKGRY